jgi:quercetin dioxygenase-like cupin family protein
MAWLHNPATGELARVEERGGQRIEADLWLQPGAAVARPHVHDHLIERVQVLEGELGVEVDGQRTAARPGDEAVEVPAGCLHDWWNASDGVSHVHVEVAGAAVDRFVGMIEAMWSLGALGRVGRGGVPTPLWLAAVGYEYRDVIRFARPPEAVLRPLAALARRTGHDPLGAELHDPPACAIPDPGEELGALLVRPVSRRRRSPGSR